MGDDSALSPAVIERLAAMKEEAREVIAESRRLRAANRRLLAQIRSGHVHNIANGGRRLQPPCQQ
jgi:hypothetical protein